MNQFAAERYAQKLSIRYVSGLCNQLFFRVNEFPAPCNHPNFLGEFVQADGWARLPVTPLNLVQVSCGELL